MQVNHDGPTFQTSHIHTTLYDPLLLFLEKKNQEKYKLHNYKSGIETDSCIEKQLGNPLPGRFLVSLSFFLFIFSFKANYSRRRAWIGEKRKYYVEFDTKKS